MILSDNLKNAFGNNNTLTTSQICALGYSKTAITAYVNEGLLVRVAHGVYALTNSTYDDMYIVALTSSKIVFSHDTALFLNGLSDRTPFKFSVTVPSNCAVPISIKRCCNSYYIKSPLYELGLTERKTTFGNMVKCYDAERTVCDILRSRSRLDEETVISALKNYSAYGGKDLNLLSRYAQELKVGKELKRYMEVLL